jgi:surfactin synthase thioesterase subunit
MGAVLAFEVARLLERDDDVELRRLFASGRRAPSTHRDETVHLRDDDGLVAELRALSGTDSQILGDEELLRMILPAIRSDYTAIETYSSTPERRIRTPITVLVGDTDSRVTLPEAQQWRVHTTGECVIRTFPGGHFYLAEQHAQVNGLVAEALLG